MSRLEQNREFENKLNTLQQSAYVLCQEELEKNLSLIDSVRKRSGANIIVALKAFAMPSAFKQIVSKTFTCGTASSPAEAELAHKYLGEKAHAYSPAYTQHDIDVYCEHCSHITFNSLSQYERFGDYATSKGLSVGLRINPMFSQVETDLYNPCAPGSRLGIQKELLPEKLPANVEGLHFHALCECGSEELEALLKSVEENFAPWLRQVKWVNMGGGHLMTRKDYNTDLLVKLLQDFRKRWNVEVTLEPGSAFAWQTGVLATRVVDIVENTGIKTAIMDCSLAAHMPDCLEMPYRPNIWHTTDKADDKHQHHYRIGGNSCLSGDFYGDYYTAEPLKVGDLLILDDMIHYTIVKTTMFNGVRHPDIFIYDDKCKLQLTRTFNYSDYEHRMG